MIVKTIDETLEEAIKDIDPRLKYEKLIGSGAYGLVAKVSKNNKPYALKVDSTFIEGGPIFARPEGSKNISYEFEIQSALSGIKGISTAIRLYQNNAFLMEYINGIKLFLAGPQPPEFFDKLKNIIRAIYRRGYTTPYDLGSSNILVDKNNEPWIVDFMLSRKITPENCESEIYKTKGRLLYIERSYRKARK